MSEWKGKVSKVNERDWGSKKIYSWQLEGTNMWFRCDTDPVLVVGKCYSFEGDSPNKIDRVSIQMVEESEVKAEAKAQTSRSNDVPPTTSPDYWRWKQMQDLDRQAYFDWRDARADATRIVCAALDNDVLALGSSKGKKLDILIGQIKDTTRMLIEKEE